MILDTNALSAFVDGDEALGRMLTGAQALAIPAIVLGEYRFGILASRRRTYYENWLIENLPGKVILNVDEETASRYAEIRHELKRKGRPIPYHDIWIAALARQHRLPVLSNDTHFDHVERVKRVDW
jgi:predicted nucleic acid-binding protein